MIERGTVDGHGAVLSYVNDKLEPVDDKNDATMIVASLDDGRKLFLVADKATPPNRSDE